MLQANQFICYLNIVLILDIKSHISLAQIALSKYICLKIHDKSIYKSISVLTSIIKKITNKSKLAEGRNRLQYSDRIYKITKFQDHMLNLKQSQSSPTKQDRFIYPIYGQQESYTLADLEHGIDFDYDSLLKRELLPGVSKDEKQGKKKRQLFQSTNMSTNFSFINYTEKNRTQVKTYQFFKAYKLPMISNYKYNTLLDWSCNNLVSIAVKKDLFAWNSLSQKAYTIYRTNKSYLTSIKYSQDEILAIGLQNGEVTIRDLVRESNPIKMKFGKRRSQCMDWWGSVLATGFQDGCICLWDVREKQITHEYKAHDNDIGSIKWNSSKSLIATGGGDNRVVLFDVRTFKYLVGMQEGFNPIKGVQWCPDNPSIVAVGGGNDRQVHFFSSTSLQHHYSIKVGLPVCNLTFSRISNELVTTHSKSSCEFRIWNSKNAWEDEDYVEQTGTMHGHRERALHMATNPKGDIVATAASDRSIKFWHPFKIQKTTGDYSSMLTSIRDLR